MQRIVLSVIVARRAMHLINRVSTRLLRMQIGPRALHPLPTPAAIAANPSTTAAASQTAAVAQLLVESPDRVRSNPTRQKKQSRPYRSQPSPETPSPPEPLAPLTHPLPQRVQ